MKLNDIKSREYYDRRWGSLEKAGSTMIQEAKNIALEMGMDTGDFDDPKYERDRRKSFNYKRVINSIASSSSRILASLLVSHLTNPMQRWFFLNADNDGDGKTPRDASIWLSQCERLMYRDFEGSKLHQALHNMYHEAELYGSGVIMKRKGKEGKAVYSPLTVGQYYFDQDEDGNINTLARRFSYTAEEIVSEFGIDNVPLNIVTQFNQGNRGAVHTVKHFVEPNLNYLPEWDNPYNKPFISTYYVSGSKTKDGFLAQKGMLEFPFYILRWDRYGPNVYGTGIGRFILGDVRMLQSYERDLAKASKKKVDPALKASPDMKNVEKNVGSNGITYTNNPEGFTALHNVNYDTQQAMANIQRVEERIKAMFFLDIFFAMMGKDKTMSATEAASIDQEKLVLLGAVSDRAREGTLDKIVEDKFSEMLRDGKFPPIPESLQGREMKINYQSVLLQAMEMTDLTNIDRYLQFTASQASFDPKAALVPNTLKINETYATKLGVDKSNLNSAEDVEAEWQAQMEAQQAQQTEVASKATLNQAKAAKELSNTNTTGQNALADMLA